MNISSSPVLCLLLTVRSIIGATAFGGAVFTAISKDGVVLRVVADHKALPSIPIQGETWEVEGVFSTHSIYGEQFVARRCNYRWPEGQLIVHYLANSPDFGGIGDARAKRLYETFGNELVAILNRGDAGALEGVLSISLAEKLVEAWAEKRADAEVVIFLDASGFDIRFSNKLRRVWGERTIEMLNLNPYYMLAFADWRQVDEAALKVGMPVDDDRRLIGAVESILYERLQESHTLTSRATLVKALNKRLQQCDAERAVELALAEGAIVGDELGGYQPISVAALECGIVERIRHMLVNESAHQTNLFGNHEAMLARRTAEVEIQQGFSLNTKQRSAVRMAVTKPFSVITGGAGSGKTTVLRVIIALAKALHTSVLQMAVTGKAAKRMAETTGHEAMTIAKFLLGVKSGKLEVAEHSLVVVDESSMLDLSTMYRILSFLPEGVRTVLMGDPAQLPPIGFGLIFHKLAECSSVPRTHLTQVHRQAESSGIPAVATSIREHTVPELSDFKGLFPGVSFIECARTEITSALFKITTIWEGESWQILSPVNDGPGGIKQINEGFHRRRSEGDVLGGFSFGRGDPVIHLVNDYERGLMNGTLGRIVEVSRGWASGLIIDFEGVKYFLASHELLGRLALAYAISVHKAQGSQFRRVAVVVKPSRILDNSLVYTALTRGIEQVVFVGDRAAFEEAVLSPSAAGRREVGFLSGGF